MQRAAPSLVAREVQLRLRRRRAGLEETSEPDPPVTLEITSLRAVDADIVEYTVGDETRAAGRRLNQLSLPDGVVVAMIARANSLIPPRGSTQILSEDHVFVVLRPETRPLVDRVFSRDPAVHSDLPSSIEFPLVGTTTVQELWEFYGIRLGMPGEMTFDEVLRDRLGADVHGKSRLMIGDATLHVREIVYGKVTTVGLALSPLPLE